ncbi:restriction endonuclease subunit S [Pyxidicoccus parkwayensis]|uniref:Restriction endonuclease subunit S n=1 Tax=Pyxidicoccus parkwayensis TaxID=2813578 RepID=A0ABX7PAX9_9BACT|nr:restriction endonuclease subunit S [Pyxidicoccus parkwaysis]QSQ27603.1 restriction endonuclease subunit S [Pyxidicoccus parkwaysis]
MSALPPGWAETHLGEILASLLDFRGRTPKKLGMDWGGGNIPALSALNVRMGSIELTRTSHFGSDALYERWMTTGDPARGDIVLTMEAPLGNVAQIPDDRRYILSQRVVLLKTMQGVNPTFLAHQMRAPEFRTELLANATGTTATGIRQSRLVELPVRIAPFPEQKRIANKLDDLLSRVDSCRNRLDRVPSIIKRFRQSVLAAATSGELTRGWREEHGFDDEWPVVELRSVATDFSYGSAAKSAKAGKVPVLRMGNIQDGYLDWQDLVFTSDVVEIAKYKLSAGDVLFNRTNSPELVGKTAVYRGDREAIYAGYLIRVRCGEHLLPDYLNYCLGSPAGRDYCWRVKSDGVSQSNINAKKLAEFSFGLPSLVEQQEIVRRVEELLALSSALLSRTQRTAQIVERLTPAALAKAFRGELVAQDPNEEPAADLLARLRAQKSVLTSQPQGRLKAQDGRKPTMGKLDKDAIKAAILKINKDKMSFDELRAQVVGDYDSLKDAIFELLEEPTPIIRQVFDKKAKTMQFERVRL